MVVTHVTQWGVPGSKHTRLYGVFSAQLLKTSEPNSHREHHKWMGTRLTQFLGSLSSLNRHFTAGMPEKSDKATEATYLFDHYCIGLNLDVCCSQCS